MEDARLEHPTSPTKRRGVLTECPEKKGVTEGRYLENVASPGLFRHLKANDARNDAHDDLDLC